MLNLNRLPAEVIEMFDVFNAAEIVALLEDLDILLVNNGARRGMDEGFEQRYATVLYLLKRSVRALGVAVIDDCDN